MSGGFPSQLNTAIASWEPAVERETELVASLQSTFKGWFTWRGPLHSFDIDGQVIMAEPWTLAGTIASALGSDPVTFPVILAKQGATDLERVESTVGSVRQDHEAVFVVLIGYDEDRIRSRFDDAGGSAGEMGSVQPYDELNLWLWESVSDVGAGDPAIMPGEDTTRGASIQASGSVSSMFD